MEKELRKNPTKQNLFEYTFFSNKNTGVTATTQPIIIYRGHAPNRAELKIL